MPAYNFKKEFADQVESGEKAQTIRPKRKRPTKPGDIIYLYTGMRTKNCRKLGEGICTHVTDIEIPKEANRFYLYGSDTPNYKGGWPAGRLVKSDGFDSWESFVEFFKVHYGLPFEGVIIRWRKTND